MGCGRVGSSLAHSLEAKGHDVAVIDQEAAAFRRLGSGFEGRTVAGVGFDRDTLREAGIERAYAFAAVSSGDNSNILAARVARETFGVENVVARIYDPGRAEVYQRLGIPTVATVRWTSDQMLRRLLPKGATPDHQDPSGRVVVAEVQLDDGWVGERISRIEEDGRHPRRLPDPARARACCRRPTRSTRTATWCTCSRYGDDLDRVGQTLSNPPAAQ